MSENGVLWQTCACMIGFPTWGSSLNAVLFDAWCQCEEGQWNKSSFYMDIKTRHSSKKRGVRKWLLEHEMNTKFTEPIAEAMRFNKRTDPKLFEKETRFHPELPQTEARILGGGVIVRFVICANYWLHGIHMYNFSICLWSWHIPHLPVLLLTWCRSIGNTFACANQAKKKKPVRRLSVCSGLSMKILRQVLPKLQRSRRAGQGQGQSQRTLLKRSKR